MVTKIVHKNIIILILICLLGIIAVFHPTIFTGFSQIQTDPGDTRLNNYILEHTHSWLINSNNHESFWDPPFFFPNKNVLAYTDLLLGLYPYYFVLRVLGFLPDTSFQLLIILMSIMN